MSLLPKGLKGCGFEHRFIISILYLEKNNNACFAGIYNKEQTEYFCIMAYGKEFIYFALNTINIERLIKNQMGFIKLIVKSRKQIKFSSDKHIVKCIILVCIFLKCRLIQYKTLPNAYYEWHAYLRNNK